MGIIKCSSQLELDKVTKKGGRSDASYSPRYPCYNIGNGMKDTEEYYINKGYKIISAEEYLNEGKIVAGDIVECVNSSCGVFRLNVNVLYKVDRVTSSAIYLENNSAGHKKSRFKKVGEEPMKARIELSKSLVSAMEKVTFKRYGTFMLDGLQYGPDKYHINTEAINPKGGSMYINSTVAKVFKDLDEALLVTEELGHEYSGENHRAFIALKSNKDAILKEAKRLRKVKDDQRV